jgi:alpha-L-arabinofuranosidase
MWNGHQVIEGSSGGYDNTYGIVEHMKMVNSLGAEALITVNYLTRLNGAGAVTQGDITSDPLPSNDQRIKRAQALVAFCNGRTADTRSLGPDANGNDWYTVGHWARRRAALGFPQPFDVRFWQVGNEPYYDIWIKTGPNPTDYTKAFDAPLAAKYGKHFNVFAQKMKEVDPKIRVGAAGMRPNQISGTNDGENWDAWNRDVLIGTQDNLDFFSIHPYYPDASGSNDPAWFKAIMAGATQALTDLRTIRKDYIDAFAALRFRNIGLALTEYGFWRNNGGTNEEWSTLGRGLLDADFLMSLIKETMDPYYPSHPLRLSVATAWNLHGCNQTASIGYTWPGGPWPGYTLPGSRVIRPQYYAMQMVKNALATKRLVQTDVVSDDFFTVDGPVGNVPDDLSVKCLQALAAVPNANKDSLVLVVLNRSIVSTIPASINHPGYTPTSVKTLGYGNSPGDHNETDPNNVKTESGSYQPPNYSFPPNSLTVFEFAKQ